MSYAGIHSVLIKDPLIDTQAEHIAGIIDAGGHINYQRYTAQNVASNNIQLVMNPPSPDTIVSPAFLTHIVWQTQFTAATPAAGGDLYNYLFPNEDAIPPAVPTAGRPVMKGTPRSFPMSNTLINAIALVNGVQFNTNSAQYFSSLSRMGLLDTKTQNSCLSTTPSMLDSFLVYNASDNSLRNPFNTYATSQNFTPRGTWNIVATRAAGGLPNPTQCTVQFEIYEYLYLSPFINSRCGLVNVSQLNLNLQFSDSNRIWSFDPSIIATAGPLGGLSWPSPAMTAFDVTVQHIVPKYHANPRDLVLDYNEILPLYSSGQLMEQPGKSYQFTINSFNLSATPRSIIMVCKPTDAVQQNGNSCAGLSDTFASLAGPRQYFYPVLPGNPYVASALAQSNPVNIIYKTQAGYLSACNPQALYAISQKNGLVMSWEEWAYEVGSVMVVSPALNFGLSCDDAPGALGINPQLTVTGTYYNNNPLTQTGGPYATGGQWGATQYVLYCFIVYQGVAKIAADGMVTKSIALLNPHDIVEAERAGSYLVREGSSIYGGGDLFGTIKGWLGKANDWLRQNRAISTAANALGAVGVPYASAVGNAAHSLGYGAEAGAMGGAMAGRMPMAGAMAGAMGGRRKRGGDIVEETVSYENIGHTMTPAGGRGRRRKLPTK